MKPIAFVINGEPGSAMDVRARSIARALDAGVVFLYRRGSKLSAASDFFRELRKIEPSVMVVFDLAVSGVVGALARRTFGGRLVIDTGDAIFALARAIRRPPVPLALTYGLEQIALRAADAIVVRGTYHQKILAERGITATVIQDGVDVSDFEPEESNVRASRIEREALVVGIVGSSAWVPHRRTAYGWELVEALAHLRDLPIAGVMVGGGTGIPHLKARARELDVEDRLRFVGQVPYADLPKHLSEMDICLSTQTNDLVGQVRTTGKLPLYMAAGRYILASDVGEASLVLPPEMRVPYDGVVDRQYPVRLAERIRGIANSRQRLKLGADNVQIAREKFDYAVLGARYRALLERVAAS